MSVFRYVFVFLLAVVAAAALASCGGDGEKKIGLLAPGEYQFTVSGTLEIEFQAESASAAAIGALQTHTADVSGDVTLKMGDDGSFDLKEWGISGKVEVNGDNVTITATDSPKEPSTGKTDKDGTSTDTYWQAETHNRTTYIGYNKDTIGMSGSDPLGPGTTSFTQETGSGTNIPFMDDAGETYLNLRHARLTFNRTSGGQTPTAQPTTPAAGGVPFALVQESVGCAHIGPGDSKIRKLVTVFSVPAPQSRQQGPAAGPSLLLLVTDDGVAPGFADLPVAKDPVVGATVTVTARAISGEGLLPGEESERAVTNAKGEARTEHTINKFGEYELTVVEVAAADGTRYQFDPASNLSETFEVGETCESPEGW